MEFCSLLENFVFQFGESPAIVKKANRRNNDSDISTSMQCTQVREGKLYLVKTSPPKVLLQFADLLSECRISK